MNFQHPSHSFAAAATELFVVERFNDENTDTCLRFVTNGSGPVQRNGAGVQTKVRVSGTPLVKGAATGLAALAPAADLGLSRSSHPGA